MKRIIYEKTGKIANIRMNRPEVFNAIDLEMCSELIEAFKIVQKDNDILVVVIAANGSNFCVGIDLKDQKFSGIRKNRTEYEEMLKAYEDMFLILRKIDKVLIAAVQGYCYGAGFELVQNCDLIISADNAKYCYPDSQVGVTPNGFSTLIMPMIIGLNKYRELVLTGNVINAEEAYRIGLANRIVVEAELENEVLKIGKEILRASPIALKNAKKLLNRKINSELKNVLSEEIKAIIDCMMTDDYVEAIQAFIEKRRPIWKGR